MTAVSKHVYSDVLDNIVNKYTNTVYRTIKMKPIDFTSDSYAEYNEDSNVTKPKFKAGDHVRISKYKNIYIYIYIFFKKDTPKIGQKKTLLLAKIKILFRGHTWLVI